MLSHLKYSKTIILLLLPVFFIGIFKSSSQRLDIKEAKLEFPNAAFPFYHFELHVVLPYPSAIEVNAFVDRTKLRYTDLFSNEIFDKIAMDKPDIVHRPPSAYALVKDNKVYKDIYIIGWWRWRPRERYRIRLEVTMNGKEDRRGRPLVLAESREVRAPEDEEVFSPEWKNYKALVVSETAGIARKDEPVDVLLPFYPDEATNIKNDIRVLEVNEQTHSLHEVPSQVYDVREYLKADEASRKVPFWYPTVTARLTFLADVPANTSKVFLVFYDNKEAKAKDYKTDLNAFVDDSLRMHIDNNYFHALLSNNSGALFKIALTSAPQDTLYNLSETNGAIQWNPDIYSPPTPWAHTSDWISPNTKAIKGPIVVKTNSWGNIDHYWGVVASVKYLFYPDKPYFIMTTDMRMNKTVNVLALRNGEMVFKRDLFDYISWYDAFTNSVVTYNLDSLPDLTDLYMDNDIPWITFYNSKTGVGFAGIQLEHYSSGIDNDPRLLNPYFYATVGPWVYWGRGLSLSYLSANPQQMIPALQGSDYFEKWAFMPYKLNKSGGGSPFFSIIQWERVLKNPLKVHLVEKVHDRVTKTIDEIMSNGKSPWEK